MESAGHDLDFIADDGGHTMHQQIISFLNLWQAVTPGGYYFLEDLRMSFMPKYGGNPMSIKSWGTALHGTNTLRMIHEIFDDLHNIPAGIGRNKPYVSADIRSVGCMREICTFTKKEAV